MSPDFLKYRLTHLSEIDQIKEEMGAEEYYSYAIDIYKFFAEMKRDQTFDLTKRVRKENIEKFVKITCLYMADFPGHLQVNNTFTKILRL